jgi:hypothetical protein
MIRPHASMTNGFFRTIRVSLAVGVAACSAPSRATFDAPIDLTATVAKGGVDLVWRNRATADGGTLVEFVTGPGETFTMLAALWPDTTHFHHPDLAPGTTFTYRIRPFFGSPSEVVSRTVGAGPGGEDDVEGPAGEPDGRGAVSLRSAETMAEAAPGEMWIALSSPKAIILRWADRASDEDGYLVEIDDGEGFRVCALLPAGTQSFRKTHLPARSRPRFRVRAFFYGPPSPLASATIP